MLLRPAAFGNLLEKQIIGPYPRLIESESPGLRLSKICISKILKVLQVLLMLADVLDYLTRPLVDKLSLLRAR